MSTNYPVKRSGGAPVGFLAILLAVGLMVAGLIPGIRELTWPLWFTVPGLAILALMKRWGRGGSWLVIPALLSIGVTLSLLPVVLLGVQALIYSWALFIPLSLGLGVGALGQMHRNESLENMGDVLSKLGAGLFIGIGMVVEIIHLMDEPTFALRALGAMAIIGVITALVARRGGRRRRRAHPHVLPRQSRALPQREVDDLEAELFGTKEHVRR